MSKEKLEGQNTHNNVLTAKGTKVFKRRNKVKAAIVACGLAAGIGGGIGIGYAIFHNEVTYTITPTSYEDAANYISWTAYQYDANNNIVDTQSGTHELTEDVTSFEVTFENQKRHVFDVDWKYTPIVPPEQQVEMEALGWDDVTDEWIHSWFVLSDKDDDGLFTIGGETSDNQGLRFKDSNGNYITTPFHVLWIGIDEEYYDIIDQPWTLTEDEHGWWIGSGEHKFQSNFEYSQLQPEVEYKLYTSLGYYITAISENK